MLGLLRGTVRPAAPGLLRPAFRAPACQLSTLQPFRHGRSLVLSLPQPALRLSLPHNSRTFVNLGSIFSRTTITPSPSPLVVARITRLEAEANVHPHDLEKQLALFHALMDTKLKTSYDLVVTRWERMCEFVRECNFVAYQIVVLIFRRQDPSSPLLQSQEAFKTYLECLVQTDQQLVSAAVKRRDALLAAQSPLGAPSTTQTDAADANSPPTPPPPAAEQQTESVITGQTEAAKPTISPSEQVAQSVLAAHAAGVASSNAAGASPMARFKSAALAPDSADGPIQVSIVERW
jgi:ATP-dependent metalloprotease